ncbi:MAG: hypothetical protein JW982_08965, partial [Spirochaetes bacterium]|nr:hypothetical protein [Spirochaetota bacterium]
MENLKYCNTSANVDGVFYDELYLASRQTGISSVKIFKDLIVMVISGSELGKITGVLTEYQDHSPERWENFYYSLNELEIEKFSKARQKYKISVSKLAFIG